MSYIIDNYNLRRFPRQHSIPSYIFSNVFGPSHSTEILDFISPHIDHVEMLDFDSDEIAFVSLHDISGSGNCLYAAYCNSTDLIYIYGSDLEYGIAFSNFELTRILGYNFIKSAKIDFIESYTKRVLDESIYYDIDIINAWAASAGLSIMQ